VADDSSRAEGEKRGKFDLALGSWVGALLTKVAVRCFQPGQAFWARIEGEEKIMLTLIRRCAAWSVCCWYAGCASSNPQTAHSCGLETRLCSPGSSGKHLAGQAGAGLAGKTCIDCRAAAQQLVVAWLEHEWNSLCSPPQPTVRVTVATAAGDGAALAGDPRFTARWRQNRMVAGTSSRGLLLGGAWTVERCSESPYISRIDALAAPNRRGRVN